MNNSSGGQGGSGGMRKKRLIRYAAAVGAALLALLGALYSAGYLRQLWSKPPGAPFSVIPGERLRFAVSSSLGESGTITVDVSPLLAPEDGRGAACRITYSLETSDKVSAVYVLRGQASVLVDAATLAPYEYEERILSGLGLTGGQSKHEKLVYDQTRHEIHYYKEKDKELRLRKTRTIPPLAQHFTSFLYLVRSTPIEPGKPIRAVMSDRKKDLAVEASVVCEEEYETASGEKRSALKLRTASDFGQEEMQGAEFLIWLDKAERFPVRLDAKTRWGTISARLVERVIQKDSATPHR